MGNIAFHPVKEEKECVRPFFGECQYYLPFENSNFPCFNFPPLIYCYWEKSNRHRFLTQYEGLFLDTSYCLHCKYWTCSENSTRFWLVGIYNVFMRSCFLGVFLCILSHDYDKKISFDYFWGYRYASFSMVLHWRNLFFLTDIGSSENWWKEFKPDMNRSYSNISLLSIFKWSSFFACKERKSKFKKYVHHCLKNQFKRFILLRKSKKR